MVEILVKKSLFNQFYFFSTGAATSNVPLLAETSSESSSPGLTMDSHVKVATPEEFVRRYGGCRVINKVLIANNGIAGKKAV